MPATARPVTRTTAREAKTKKRPIKRCPKKSYPKDRRPSLEFCGDEGGSDF